MTPAARRVSAPPGGLRIRVGDRVHDTADAGLDQRLGAGAGATGVVTRFEGDVGGAAAGLLACFAQGVDLGVRPAGALVEAFTGRLSFGVEDHASDDRIGAGGAESAGGERDRSAHGGGVGCGVHRVLLPLRARTPGPVDDDR
ncbi:hypothetical protein GCM10018966_025490 [Streptomyces yanii]